MVVATSVSRASRTKKYSLCPIDKAQGDSHIMFVYFYPNRQGKQNFMPTATLLDGFNQATRHFSILLGQLNTKHGRQSVLVDNLCPNTPHFKEICTDMQLEALIESEYSWNHWPSGLDTKDTIDLHNGKPLLLSAVLLRFGNNTGVALRVKARHSVMDGTGFTSFMRLWSNIVRSSVASLAGLYLKIPVEYPVLDFNRQSLLRAIDYSRKPSSNVAYNGISKEDDIDQHSTHMDSEARESGTMHIFRFAEDALCRIKKDLSSNCSTISVNDALTALIWRAIARSSYKATQHQLVFACDVRKRIGLLQNYMGNASFPLQIDLGRQQLLEQPKHATASKIRSVVNNVDAKYFLQCLHFLSQHGPIIDMESKFGSDRSFFCTTNCSRFPFYQTDFGYGRPDRVLVPHYLTPGFSIWLPTNDSGGIDAIISMLDCDFKRVSNDSELLEYCEIII